MTTIRIEPQGETFEARPGQTLLQAALRANVVIPSSCRNGTCRTCICRLRQGSVTYNIEWPGLLAEEKSQGYILPCVALPEGDVVLDFSANP